MPFFMLWCTIAGLSAQSYEQEIATIKNQITLAKDSTILTSLYNELSFAYRRFSVDSLEHYARKAISIAEKTNDIPNLAKGYKNVGIAQYKNGSDYNRAIENFEIALEYAKQVDDYATQVGCLNNIGIIYHTISQFHTSLKYYYQGLELYDQEIDKNEFLRGLLLGNIGTSYRELQNREKEFEFIEGVISYANDHGHPRLFIIYCDDYVMSLHKNDQSEKALEICENCVRRAEEIKDYHSITQALYIKAKIKYDLKLYDEAIRVATESEKIATEKKIDLISSSANLIQAQALEKIGKDELAKQKAINAYKIGIESNKYYQSSLAAQLLSTYYANNENYEKAYFYQSEYTRLTDANNDQLSNAQAEELEAKYEVDNYVKQIDSLNEQNLLQNKINNLYAVAIVLMSLGIIMTFIFYRNSKRSTESLIKLNEEIKTTQKELQYKHDELDAIFRNSYEGIIYKEINSGKMITCNQIALDIHEAEHPNEITNLMPLDRYPYPTVNGISKEDYVAIQRDTLHKKGYLNTVWQFRRKDGIIKHVAIHAITDHSDNKNPKIVAFYNDITEEVEAKKTLELHNRELEKYIESNIQLEQFAHVASHDLRAPLITINSFSKLLKNKAGSKLSEDENKYLDFISTNGNQMFDLVNDLLEYSKINSQKINLSEVNLSDVIKGVCNTLKRQAQTKKVNISLPKNIPNITADEIKIKRVFQNLLSNAIKFSDDQKDDSFIKIDFQESPDIIEFSIEDNGVGMKKHDIDIFQPYTQLHNKGDYRGTGMGLSFCQKIVKQHNGKIDYQSEYGIGTKFTFTIDKTLKG